MPTTSDYIWYYYSQLPPRTRALLVATLPPVWGSVEINISDLVKSLTYIYWAEAKKIQIEYKLFSRACLKILPYSSATSNRKSAVAKILVFMLNIENFPNPTLSRSIRIHQ